MDERIFRVKRGLPPPAWDLDHRLPTESPVGPDCKDSGVTYRIGANFMDVTDQTHMIRHLTGAALVVSILSASACSAAGIMLISGSDVGEEGIRYFAGPFLIALALPFCFVIQRTLVSELFGLRRRPIRFNRTDKNIYAVRRRLSQRQYQGDEVWEIPWSNESLFCIHKNELTDDVSFQIRYYQVDAQGNVMRGMALGREWIGAQGLEALLAQWNYWVQFMKYGPEHLPLPALFISETESVSESFLTCMYQTAGSMGIGARLILMPVILLFTALRIGALAMCREPIWPPEIVDRSNCPDCGFTTLPRGETPVGWGATAIARSRNQYPTDPRAPARDWTGEVDSMTNARSWLFQTLGKGRSGILRREGN